jgi:hypothetical protein
MRRSGYRSDRAVPAQVKSIAPLRFVSNAEKTPPLADVLAKAAAFIDGIIDEGEQNFRIDMQDRGMHPDDIDEILAEQRAEVTATRAKMLAVIEASLPDGGEQDDKTLQ